MTSPDLTKFLRTYRIGRPVPHTHLASLLYAELRSIAAHHFRREKPGHLLQRTALVHELFLRFFTKSSKWPCWTDRGHFFAVASREMRRILVEHARSNRAIKRGGDNGHVTFDEQSVHVPQKERYEAIHDALTRLEAFHSRQAKIVELRFFAGLSIEETAQELGISLTTVKDDFALAKAWLRRELEERP